MFSYLFSLLHIFSFYWTETGEVSTIYWTGKQQHFECDRETTFWMRLGERNNNNSHHLLIYSISTSTVIQSIIMVTLITTAISAPAEAPKRFTPSFIFFYMDYRKSISKESDRTPNVSAWFSFLARAYNRLLILTKALGWAIDIDHHVRSYLLY